MIDLTQIIIALIWLCFALITGRLVPFIKEKFDNEKYAKVMMWVSVAVEAAEQIFAKPGMGAEKKKYVVEFLKYKGFVLDEKELDVVIESAVLELKHSIDA